MTKKPAAPAAKPAAPKPSDAKQRNEAVKAHPARPSSNPFTQQHPARPGRTATRKR